VLRIIAVAVGLAVVVNATFIVQAGHGGFTALLHSGPLGLISTAGWLIIMVAAAVGAILLWQMRRIGLVVTVALCRVAFVYYIVGFMFRAPQSPVTPILAAAALNGLVLAVLASSAARRGVS
jgi:CHASE2 domain-containing sensor protein